MCYTLYIYFHFLPRDATQSAVMPRRLSVRLSIRPSVCDVQAP